MSIRQSQHVLKFLMVIHDLQLIPESTFADTAYLYDDYVWEIQQFSWEAPPPQWVPGRVG